MNYIKSEKEFDEVIKKDDGKDERDLRGRRKGRVFSAQTFFPMYRAAG